MEELQHQQLDLGFDEKPYQYYFCDKKYKTTDSRANHYNLKHPRLHEKLKFHNKVLYYPCKQCFVGFGDRHSKRRH
jgi:hypothetical protein